MQTLEFTRALQEIVKELKADEIVTTIQSWFQTQFAPQQPPPIQEQAKDSFAELLLSSRSGYDRLSTQSTAGRILSGLGVKEFYDPRRMRQLIHALSSAGNLAQIQALPEMHAYFEKFRSLPKLAATCVDLLEKEKIGTVKPDDAIMELEIINYADEDGISPRRLSIFVSSVSDLHRDAALILGTPTDTLTFKYFDSGSDLLVGIQSAKGIAELLNTLLSQWWDKLRFWRYETFDKRMAAISKSLEVIEKVRESVEKKTITGEEGEILKLRIFRQVDTLIGIGVTVPLGEAATVDQKQLLTELRNTKLLGTGGLAEPSNTLPEKT